jgi:integrase
MFERMRQEHGLAYDERLVAGYSEISTVPSTIPKKPVEAALEPAQPESSHSMSLEAVYERFLADPTKRRSTRTLLAHQTTCRVAKEVLGAETPIKSISRENCRELLDILHWLPVNYSKKYPKLTVRQAAAKAQADKSIATINATNLNAYMARFATMLNWAVTEEYITRNPAKGLQLTEPVRPQDRRRPFELWQLQKIFTAPIFTGCKDDQAGYASPGSVIAEGARYWVPLIGLFSGMRLNEICQLDVTDIRVIDGVACFVVTEESLTGSRDKSLKTKSSARIVPVHPQLLDLSFMAFAERKERGGAIKVFDDLPLGAKGFRSIAFSRWFARFLQSSGASASKTCFHSFRHCFRDAARNARIDRDIVLTLGGWVTGGGKSDAAEAYGKGYNAQVLYAALATIKYPDLDLSHLLL